jgi:peptidoglycan/LPS O-acetylase OafA/YrhL
MLRGFAVLAVLWYHWMSPIFGFDRLPWNGLWSDFAAAPATYWLFYPVSHGWVAVPAFFVLSGFVIHLSTMKAVAKTGKLDIGEFFRRRFWRIYPVYAVAVLAFGLTIPFGKFDILAHLLCIHNFFPGTLFTISPAFWSLASEVQFYIVYPFIAPLLLRNGVLPALKGASLLTLAVIAVTFVALDPGAKAGNLFYWWSPLITWSSWLLGAYLAERYAKKQGPMGIGGGWAVVGVALYLLSAHCRVLFPFAFPIAAVLAALWIDRLAHNSSPVLPWERFFVGIGLVSYSMYVWHHPLLTSFHRWITGVLGAVLPSEGIAAKALPALTMGLGVLPVAAAVALLSWASYHVIEKNGIRFGAALGNKLRSRLSEQRGVGRNG